MVEEPASVKTHLWVFFVASVGCWSWQILGPFVGGLSTLIGGPCVALMLIIGILFAPVRWNYPEAVDNLGKNYWFRWLCYLGVYNLSIKVVVDLTVKTQLYKASPNYISDQYNASNPTQYNPTPGDFDHWYIRGKHSMLQREFMNRTDLDPTSGTYGLWTPPPEWRDECIKTGGAPLFACSYFAYEEYPAFMTIFYVLYYGGFVVHLTLEMIYSHFEVQKWFMKMYRQHKGVGWVWKPAQWEKAGGAFAILNYEHNLYPLVITYGLLFSGIEFYEFFGSGMGLTNSFGSGKLYYGADWNQTPIPSLSELSHPLPIWFQAVFGNQFILQYNFMWLWGQKQMHWAAMMTGLVGPFPLNSTIFHTFRLITHICMQNVMYMAVAAIQNSNLTQRAGKAGSLVTINAPPNVLSLRDWWNTPDGIKGMRYVFIIIQYSTMHFCWWGLWELPAIFANNQGESDDTIVSKWLSLVCCFHVWMPYWQTFVMPIILWFVWYAPAIQMYKAAKATGAVTGTIRARVKMLFFWGLSGHFVCILFGSTHSFFTMQRGQFFLMTSLAPVYSARTVFRSDEAAAINLLSAPMIALLTSFVVPFTCITIISMKQGGFLKAFLHIDTKKRSSSVRVANDVGVKLSS